MSHSQLGINNGVVETPPVPCYICFTLLGFLLPRDTEGCSPQDWERQKI